MTNPIFIVGTPRSGTTLTATILGRHGELFMPGETHFFDDVYSRKEQLGSPNTAMGSANIAERLFTIYARFNESSDQARIERLTSQDELANEIRQKCLDYGDVFRLFMELQMHRVAASQWGNNTPRDIFNIRDIKKYFPAAKVIVCVRDPRDFLGSYKGKWRSTSAGEVSRLKQLYHPIVTALLWRASMGKIGLIRQSFEDSQVLILPYESLVTRPIDAVEELCTYLGVEFDAGMLEVDFTNSSDDKDKGNVIYSGSIESWRSRISTEEAWIAQRVCQREMLLIGYKQLALHPNLLRICGYLLSAPFMLAKGLFANRKKRGPLIPYLIKRFAAFSNGG